MGLQEIIVGTLEAWQDEGKDYIVSFSFNSLSHELLTKFREVVEGAGLTNEMIRALIDKAEEEYADVDMTDVEWEEKRWMIIAEAMKQPILKAMGDKEKAND